MKSTHLFYLNIIMLIAILNGCSEKDDDAVTYTLTAYSSPKTGGIIEGTGEYEPGTEVYIQLTIANRGHEFLNWTDEDGNIISEKLSFPYNMPDHDVTLIANFHATDYNLNIIFDPSDAADVILTPDKDYYHAGDSIAIELKPNEGYLFSHWRENYSDIRGLTSTIDTIVMSSRDIELMAVFYIDENGVLGNGVNDIDGNTYRTVWIGGREWMAENLRTTAYNNGTPIPNVTDGVEWDNLTTEAYCWYNNDPDNGEPYGALYNGYAVENNKLCPEGWKVPSRQEWIDLIIEVDSELTQDSVIDVGWYGVDVGRKLKATYGWNSDGNGTDEFGFSILPSGVRTSGFFLDIGTSTFLWSSDQQTFGGFVRFEYNRDDIFRHVTYKNNGFCIRCIKEFD